MYDIASSTAEITTALQNTGTLVALVLASVVIGVIALMGLGYAIRHLKKWILGRRF